MIIPLTKNKFAIVDPGDFEYLNQFKWHLHSKGYASRNIRLKENWKKRKNILMHRVVLERHGHDLSGLVSDHINRDKLDNRSINLRAVTLAQNRFNSNFKNSSSSVFNGVHETSNKKKWRASIGRAGKSVHLGYFANEEDAAKAYDSAAINYFGEFAKGNLNFG